MTKEPLLRCENIFKSFGATKALAGVSLNVYPGEIHGLIGENGCGKSTLCSIIAGVQPYDDGQLFFNGQRYLPSDMVDAQKTGVSMVVQEMGTIPNITVAANIFAGKERLFTKGIFLDVKKMNAEAKKILNGIGAAHISPMQLITALNPEDRKLVEIARALYSSPALFIIDETTTALSQLGRDIIYRIIRGMVDEGKAVLFISHDLEELMSVSNAISVLRDGQLVAVMSEKEMDIHKMRLNMVGREISDDYYRTDLDFTSSEEVVLKAENISNGVTIHNVSFELHRGEILGIGGLSECGMHELGRALFGADRILTGSIKAGNVRITSPTKATKAGIAYVSKKRDEEGLILSDSIENNIALPSLREISSGIYIPRRNERKLALKQVDEMNIKCENVNQLVNQLSGGNKQKVVFAKWLGKQSDIFILDCPTRGIDIGVKVAMYRLIYRLKEQGKSIVLISEELPELIGMSDRIIVLKNGSFSTELMRSQDLKESDIIQHMI